MPQISSARRHVLSPEALCFFPKVFSMVQGARGTEGKQAIPIVPETKQISPENQPHASSGFRTILGIRFFTGTARQAVDMALRGGLVVVPSAPVLCTMCEDKQTQAALMHCDLAITDSGLMVRLWNFLRRDNVIRLSGLEYLQLLLKEPSARAAGAALWIMPHERAMEWNLAWLQKQGHTITRKDCYLAPHYDSAHMEDPALLRLLQERKPRHVIMAVGGGTQEKLGYYLRRNLDYLPTIHCTGAAIGFLTGEQVKIPTLADRCVLGWLWRCVSNPRVYVPRYWRARKLIPLLFRHQENFPESASE
jgi:N-acetylglucosaminyldiphosphoundecaprenol N-acetyl-beta-D-mannosaminyltransferase